MSLDHFTFARAYLHWAATHHLLPWWEYKLLMRGVIAGHRKSVGCEGKEGFDTFETANTIAKLRRGKHGHKRRAAFRCAVCSRWHLGNARDSREKRMLKERALS